jgi:hypothetical protein
VCGSADNYDREGLNNHVKAQSPVFRATFDDDEESERLLRGFLSGARYEGGLYCRADDRGDR